VTHFERIPMDHSFRLCFLVAQRTTVFQHGEAVFLEIMAHRKFYVMWRRCVAAASASVASPQQVARVAVHALFLALELGKGSASK